MIVASLPRREPPYFVFVRLYADMLINFTAVEGKSVFRQVMKM